MEKEKICTYALSRIFVNEPLAARSLVETLGSAAALFELDDEGIDAVFGPFNKLKAKIRGVRLDRYADELETILSRGCRYLARYEKAFPAALDQCPDAPLGLFVRAADTLENIFSAEMIAVVGTRDASGYGREWTGKAVACLGGGRVGGHNGERYGQNEGVVAGQGRQAMNVPTIVSGLAYGIDICAHKSAMENSMPTIAVLGTGIFNTYPRQHEAYLQRIIELPRSAVISEYPPDKEVFATNFLGRNRIIAGLSRSTILVESRVNGGGMTTARIAFSYGREVFAVPGRNDDIRSQGCNLLIQQHVAEPLISCESFLKALEYEVPVARNKGKDIRAYYGDSVPDEELHCLETLYVLIKNSRDITIEDLATRSGYPMSLVLPMVSRLESDSLICVDLLRRCSLSR